MTRALLVLVLLSGCATPRAVSTVPSAPRSLAEVNDDLREVIVQIELADGSAIDRAEDVRVDRRVTNYTLDGIDGVQRLAVPTTDVVRMVVVRERPRSGGGGAIVGAMPGVLLAFGSMFIRPGADDGPTERFNTSFGATFGVYGGLTFALIGGVVGASATGRDGPMRYSVVYEAPISRYLSPPAAPGDARADR